MHDVYDRGSKWLIQHRGDSILRLAGLEGIQSWRALATDFVQPRRLPDGLLEAQFLGREQADLFLLEIATHPEVRVPEQMVRGAMLVWLDRDVLPEVITLVLSPHGRKRVAKSHHLRSPRALTDFRFRWRVVELWTLPAEQLLATNDVGLVPWVPLTQFAGPPEPLLRECCERINRQAPPNEHENLLVVTHVLASLRYDDQMLTTILGGKQAMTRFPFLQELMVERTHELILIVLEGRFGTVPPDVADALRQVTDETKLRELTRFAGTCADLEAFRTRLV